MTREEFEQVERDIHTAVSKGYSLKVRTLVVLADLAETRQSMKLLEQRLEDRDLAVKTLEEELASVKNEVNLLLRYNAATVWDLAQTRQGMRVIASLAKTPLTETWQGGDSLEAIIKETEKYV